MFARNSSESKEDKWDASAESKGFGEDRSNKEGEGEEEEEEEDERRFDGIREGGLSISYEGREGSEGWVGQSEGDDDDVTTHTGTVPIIVLEELDVSNSAEGSGIDGPRFPVASAS